MADLKKIVASAGIVVAIATFTNPFEGLRTKAYPDPADPAIATICIGETKGVHFGDTKTPEECRQMLEHSILDYLHAVDKKLPGLPDNRRIAYGDAAYNLGPGFLTWRIKKKVGASTISIVGSSIFELERAGRWPDACRRLLDFDTAGGVQMLGLTRRRQSESALCLENWQPAITRSASNE